MEKAEGNKKWASFLEKEKLQREEWDKEARTAIKKTEARVGNIAHEYLQTKPIKITEIMGKWWSFSYIPIPLTELWFEKFGFKSVGLHGQRFEIPIDNENIFAIEYDGQHFYAKINFEDCCFYEFKYVHQLQNLYFTIAGKELKIIKKQK